MKFQLKTLARSIAAALFAPVARYAERFLVLHAVDAASGHPQYSGNYIPEIWCLPGQMSKTSA